MGNLNIRLFLKVRTHKYKEREMRQNVEQRKQETVA